MSPTPQSPDRPRDDGVAKVAELIAKAKACMLTTTGPDGGLVARPMGLQEVAFDGDLWFFADATSAKAAQIRATPAVNVSFSDDEHGSWTSIAGRAEVVHDADKAEALWSPVLKAWFPDGLQTAGLALIKVHADSAQCWDGPTTTAGWVIGVARAALTGEPGKDPITNDTVAL